MSLVRISEVFIHQVARTLSAVVLKAFWLTKLAVTRRKIV